MEEWLVLLWNKVWEGREPQVVDGPFVRGMASTDMVLSKEGSWIGAGYGMVW